MNEPPDAWEERLRQTARHMVYPPTPPLAEKGAFPTQRTMRPARWQWATIAVVLVLIAAVVSVPSVRAGLADILQIGSVQILFGQPTPTAVVRPTSDLGEVITLEEAEARLDFPFRLPTFPETLGAPDEVVLLTQEEDGGVGLTWYDESGNPYIRLYEFGAGFWAEKWGPEVEGSTPSTMVNGYWAVWLPGPHIWGFVGPDAYRTVAVPEGKYVLIWAEGDATYRLESGFTMEEAVRIAESLREMP